MSNDLRILPLRRYEVYFPLYTGDEMIDVFTADYHNVDEQRITRFYRTGNVIREYHTNLIRIVITPADEEDTA